MPEPSGVPYKVVHSQAILATLRSWTELADRAGLRREYADALRVVQRLLEREPLTWGDPLYRLQHLDLTIYRGMHWFLIVDYGIHDGERLTFVRQYRLKPGNPLETTE